MEIRVCDKCGKRIKGDVNTLTYRSFLRFTSEVDFCDDCFDEILHYKKQAYEKGKIE